MMIRFLCFIFLTIYFLQFSSCSCQNSPNADNDRKKNGTYQEFYDNGKIKDINNYLDDVLEGWQISFFENGRVESAYMFKGGAFFGEGKQWHRNGEIRRIEYYISDMRNDSIYNVWYDNGNKRLEGQYKTGIMQGLWVQYYNTGDTALVRNYTDQGEPKGIWRFYRLNGALDKVIDFNIQSTSIKVFPYRSKDGEVFYPED